MEVLDGAVRHEKYKAQIKKEQVKLLLFADDILLCIGNAKDCTKHFKIFLKSSLEDMFIDFLRERDISVRMKH